MNGRDLEQKIQSAKNITPEKKEEILLLWDFLSEKQKKSLQLAFLAEDFFSGYAKKALEKVNAVDRKYRQKILQTAEKLSS